MRKTFKQKLTSFERIIFAGWCATFVLQTSKHYFFAQSYVAGLPIDYLSLSIYLSDLVLLIGLVLAILIRCVNRDARRWFFTHKNEIALMCAFGLFYLCLSLLSPALILALIGAKEVVMGLLLILYLLVRPWSKADVCLGFFCLMGAVFFESVLAIAEWWKQGSLGLQILGEWRFSVLDPAVSKVDLFGALFLRPMATFPHPNVLAGFLALSGPLALYGLAGRSHRFKLWGISVFLLSAMAEFLTFSRVGWIIFLLHLVGLFLIVRGWRISLFKRYRRYWMLGLTGLLVIASLFFLPIIWSRVSSLWLGDSETWQRRVELNRTAIDMIRSSPFVGVGVHQFIPNMELTRGAILGTGRWLQPVHNLYLLLAAEMGIPFLLMALLLIAGVIWRVSTLRIPPTLLFWCWARAEILLLWIMVLMIGLFDHYLWTIHAGQFIFFGLIGLSLVFYRRAFKL